MTIAARLNALADAVRVVIGAGSYRAYRDHMASHHPGSPMMDEAAFFRARQQARYGGKNGGRCC